MEIPENITRAVELVNRAADTLKLASEVAGETGNHTGFAGRLASMSVEASQYAEYIQRYFDVP